MITCPLYSSSFYGIFQSRCPWFLACQQLGQAIWRGLLYNCLNQNPIIMIKAMLLALAACIMASANFVPYMPVCAIQELRSEITYTLANFGHILYGRTVVGNLIIPEETQFCSNENTESFVRFGDDMKKFVLIKRGTCKFTKKILNAQRRGADMVIIYDNDKTSAPNVIMANDGHGHLVDIPSIFISNSDGEKIINTFNKCDKSIIFKMTYDVYVNETAKVKFWLDASNRESFITIRDFFRDYYGVIKKKVQLDLRFKVLKTCGKENCDSQDCILDNKEYCLPEKKTRAGLLIEGKNIINEHLREYFLFEQLKAKKKIQGWVDYMLAFDDQLCLEELDVKECSYKIMKKYGDKDAVDLKVAETYTNLTQGKENAAQMFTQEAYKHDILFYPEVSINGRNFYGLFRAPDIFEMICQSLQDPPKECHSFIKNDRKQSFGPDDTSGLWITVLQILAFMLVTFLLALFIYTRLIRKEINQQMSVQVNRMVQHYVAMTEEKSRSSVM